MDAGTNIELCTALCLQLDNRHSFLMLLKAAKDDAGMSAKKIAKATVREGEDIIFDLYVGQYKVANIYTVWNYAKEHLSKREANKIGSHVAKLRFVG